MKTVHIIDKCKASGKELAGLIRYTTSPTVSSMTHLVLYQLIVNDEMETCLVDPVAASESGLFGGRYCALYDS